MIHKIFLGDGDAQNKFLCGTHILGTFLHPKAKKNTLLSGRLLGGSRINKTHRFGVETPSFHGN